MKMWLQRSASDFHGVICADSKAGGRDTKTEIKVDIATVERLTAEIKIELRRLMPPGVLTIADPLSQVFTRLFGSSRTRQEQVRFFVLAAPIARRIAISLADPQARIAAEV